MATIRSTTPRITDGIRDDVAADAPLVIRRKPMLISRYRIFPILFALAACTTTSAPEHRSQRDPDANIAAWSTFGWKPAVGAAASEEPLRILDVNIRNAIVAELTRRGYQEAETEPQFLVTYDFAAQEKVKSNPFQIGIGMGSFGGDMGGSVNVGSPSVQSYQEGRLVVHVIDAAANKEVWYGTVSGRVENQSLDADAVARVVALALQDFPPRTPAP
jgi:hypothetical protein